MASTIWRARVLRHVGPAFVEDPVRVLRLARFAARFPAFTVAPETLALAQEMVANGELDHLVAERVWQELAKGLMEDKPSRMFEVLRECGALARLLPELDRLFGVPQRAEIPPGNRYRRACDDGRRSVGAARIARCRSASPRCSTILARAARRPPICRAIRSRSAQRRTGLAKSVRASRCRSSAVIWRCWSHAITATFIAATQLARRRSSGFWKAPTRCAAPAASSNCSKPAPATSTVAAGLAIARACHGKENWTASRRVL
jgi:hypothetical protein